MSFKDHFSGHAAEYAQFRPEYPTELFKYLTSIAPGRAQAWDCATGNGQAAIALASHFSRVIATDASAQQIANARQHDRVEYRVATAEASGLDDNSIDLITVAQALHWFDLPRFFSEATRVLKSRGAIAVWAYNLLQAGKEIDAIIRRFYRETTDAFWPPERSIVEAGYRTINFPFQELQPPGFEMRTRWNLDQLLGYLRTWSATKKFIAARGFDPLDDVAAEMRAFWPQREAAREMKWPLHLRVGICLK
ncbi:MAG: class I SAM-dependent methyltransferase [Chthoniobacterales bacterium]